MRAPLLLQEVWRLGFRDYIVHPFIAQEIAKRIFTEMFYSPPILHHVSLAERAHQLIVLQSPHLLSIEDIVSRLVTNKTTLSKAYKKKYNL